MRISKESCAAALAVLVDAYSGVPVGIDKKDLLSPIAIMAMGASDDGWDLDIDSEWDETISITEAGAKAVEETAQAPYEESGPAQDPIIYWPEGTPDTGDSLLKLWKALGVGERVNAGPWEGWQKTAAYMMFTRQCLDGAALAATNTGLRRWCDAASVGHGGWADEEVGQW